MEKVQTALEGPVTAGPLTIRAVSLTWLAGGQTPGGPCFTGSKQPLYILVSGPEPGLRAFDAGGRPLPWQEIAGQYPELRAALAELA